MPPKRKLKSRLVEKVDKQAGGETGNLDQQLTYPPKKRVFPCQFCAKEFLRNEHLQRHERLRMANKPGSEMLLIVQQILRKSLSAAQPVVQALAEGISRSLMALILATTEWI